MPPLRPLFVKLFHDVKDTLHSRRSRKGYGTHEGNTVVEDSPIQHAGLYNGQKSRAGEGILKGSNLPWGHIRDNGETVMPRPVGIIKRTDFSVDWNSLDGIREEHELEIIQEFHPQRDMV